MAVKAIKKSVKYRSTDGNEYDTKEEAERHDALWNARNEFDNARKKFGKLLAETQTTGDGEAFEFGWRSYWYVTPTWGGFPELRTIRFSEYQFDFDDSDVFQIFNIEDGNRKRYAISDLYVSKHKARAALIAAQEERVRFFRETIDEHKAFLDRESQR